MKYGYSSTIITGEEGESKPLKAGFPADNANNAGMIPAAAGAFVHTKKSRLALLVGVFIGALVMGALTNTNKSTVRMKSKESKEETLFMVASDKSELSESEGELTWSGLRMSQESITSQLVDSKEDVSTCTPPCVHQWI